MEATRHEPFRSFDEFYRFHLSEHRSAYCRRMHFFGMLGALFCLAKFLVTLDPWWLVASATLGYGLAWVGHFVFEKNQPALLRQPLYAFMGDWVMFRDILVGRVPF